MKTCSIGLPAAIIMAVACASPQAARAADNSHAAVPAVLVANHGPFTWGRDAFEAVDHAGAEIMHHHVGAPDKVEGDQPAARVLQVEGEALFAVV